MDRTIVAFNGPGEGIFCAGSTTLECSDVYGNTGGDWVGCLAGQAGQNGNFASDPLFCDAPHRDFRLNAESECNQPPCGLIGAWPVGCPTTGAGEITAGAGPFIIPNPTSGPCRVIYQSAGSATGSVLVLDVSGRVVRRLIRNARQPVGAAFAWDGRDETGAVVPAGVYLTQLTSAAGVRAGRLVVVR